MNFVPNFMFTLYMTNITNHILVAYCWTAVHKRCFIKTNLWKRLVLKLKSSNISVVGINLSVNNIVHEANIKIKSCTSFSLNIRTLLKNYQFRNFPFHELAYRLS
jgi:hypothetical protein